MYVDTEILYICKYISHVGQIKTDFTINVPV